MTDVEKFTYLRSYLTGDALRLQAGLALTSSNYRVALELLERRFGTKQVIINSHMEFLYKLPVIRSSEDVRSIRDFHDKIEMNLRSLHASVDVCKINDLMKELKLKIEARERVRDTKRAKSQHDIMSKRNSQTQQELQPTL